jgi:hypothetical protein
MSLENTFENEMRFAALEYMVSNLYVTILQATRSDKSMIDEAHAQLIERAGARTYPKLDPAQSDVAAAAFQEAIHNLVNAQREMLGYPKI